MDKGYSPDYEHYNCDILAFVENRLHKIFCRALADVNFYDMNVSGGDSVYAGMNVHIVAKVSDYNSNSQLFELDIISMTIRN